LQAEDEMDNASKNPVGNAGQMSRRARSEFGQRRRITAASLFTGELNRDRDFALPYTREDFYSDPPPRPKA